MLFTGQCGSGEEVRFKKSALKMNFFQQDEFSAHDSCKKISDKRIKDYPICNLAPFLYLLQISLPSVVWLEKSVDK
jgi:hypothetical protein